MIAGRMIWIVVYKTQCWALHQEAMRQPSSPYPLRPYFRPPIPIKPSSKPTKGPSTSKSPDLSLSRRRQKQFFFFSGTKASIISALGASLRAMRISDAIVRSPVERCLQHGHPGLRPAPGTRSQAFPRQRTRNRWIGELPQIETNKPNLTNSFFFFRWSKRYRSYESICSSWRKCKSFVKTSVIVTLLVWREKCNQRTYYVPIIRKVRARAGPVRGLRSRTPSNCERNILFVKFAPNEFLSKGVVYDLRESN